MKRGPALSGAGVWVFGLLLTLAPQGWGWAAQPPTPPQLLERAQTAFFEAGDLPLARSLAGQVLETDAGNAGAHEILGLAAQLELDQDGAFRHFLEAVPDLDSDATRLHLLKLEEQALVASQWQLLEQQLGLLAKRHPDPAVGAQAAHLAARCAWRLGRVSAVQELVGPLGFVRAWQIIAGFPNDQQSGFDTAFGPELEGVNLERSYEGQRRPALWRALSVVSRLGSLDLQSYHTPGQWSVAYLVTWVQADQAGEAELRISTGDPVKVWWNEGLVLKVRNVETATFDHLVATVQLQAGWNRLMLKSCQGVGSWQASVRVTGKGGAPLPGLRFSQEPHPTPQLPPAHEWNLEQDFLGALALTGTTGRQAFVRAETARLAGFNTAALELFSVGRQNKALGPVAVPAEALAAWTLEENERALDGLTSGISSYPLLALLPYTRARFFQARERYDRALADVDRALQLAPQAPLARLLRARLFKQKQWLEEACREFEALAATQPGWPEVLGELAGCAQDRLEYPAMRAWLQRSLEAWPTDRETLKNLAERLIWRDDDGEALKVWSQYSDYYPDVASPYLSMGNIQRRNGRFKEAADLYRRITELDPEWGVPYVKLGDLELQQGRNEAALGFWRQALLRNPDQAGLWERLDRLAPASAGLFDEAVPSPAKLERILKDASAVKALRGASAVRLLKHGVVQVNRDASTREVHTEIIRIEDQLGREAFSVIDLPKGGSARVLTSFILDPDGHRREAASVRDRQIRFQNLQTGSIIVFQYRHDLFQQGVLLNYWAHTWACQSAQTQEELAQWVVIVPKDLGLRHHTRGPIKHAVSQKGEYQVHSWTAAQVPPLNPEPESLPEVDLLARVRASTMPDWAVFADWMRAMLVQAAQVTPALRQAAEELTAGAGSKRERLDRVFRFVADNVRYVQDYEVAVAAVRPHRASVVLERHYGDCKDKSVLLHSLLAAQGIEARFALVSTRDNGQITQAVPSASEFNHMVVLVPEQEGLKQELVLDGTASYLDAGITASGVQGCTLLVLKDRGYEFKKVPFGAPDQERSRAQIRLGFSDASGVGRGTLRLSLEGEGAAGVRRAGGNVKAIELAVAGLVGGQLFPGATVTRLQADGASDSSGPAAFNVEFEAPDVLVPVAHGNLQMSLVKLLSLTKTYGAWSKREHPIRFGPPKVNALALEFSAPTGYEVSQLPAPLVVKGRCSTFRFQSALKDGVASYEYELVRTCTEVPADQYEDLRRFTLEVELALSRPVLLKPAGAPGD